MVAQEGTRSRGRTGRWGGSRYTPRRKVCSFCSNNIKKIGYKDPSVLLRYISDRGKIEPRRRTGSCAKHQRALALAIKRARHLVLLPFAPAHIYEMGLVKAAAVPSSPIAPKPEKAAAIETVAETAKKIVEKEPGA